MKKFLSVLLALAMVATLFVAIPATVSAGGTNVGKVEDGYTPAEGSIGISSAEEFAKMDPTKNYHLTADITITAPYNYDVENDEVLPVTENTGNKSFRATLDGMGHTVTVSSPMFSHLSSNAVIKNLIIEGNIDNYGFYCGVVAMYSNNNVTFENIYNKADASASSYCASLLGYANNGCDIVIRNCLNEGDMTGTGVTAGLVGYVQDDTLTMENCINTGAIESSGNYAGGIVGRMGRDSEGSGLNRLCTIKNCENYGTVKGVKGQVAGILGYALAVVTIENCNNYGDIENTNGAAAGIFGILGNKVANVYGLDIKNCVNYGNISGNIAAGIVARQGRNASSVGYNVENCENHGDIICNLTNAAPGTSSSKQASYYVGGISGYSYGGSATTNPGGGMINCINTGDIIVTGPAATLIWTTVYVSGIIGYTNSSYFTAKNNINLGKISYSGYTTENTTVSETDMVIKYNLGLLNIAAEQSNFANNYVINDFTINSVKSTVDTGKGTIITTAEQAQSGELAYLVNQGAGENVFFQNLTEAPVDTHPTVFAADDGSNIVIKNGDAYTNPSTDFSAINALIESANALDENDYSANWAEFAAALEAAKTVAANASAKQTDVDAAILALDNAINALVTKKFAKIGDVEYTSLEAAIEAAQAGDTIVLLDNIVAKATVTVNKSVTIDGNGKSITSDGFNAIDVSGSSITVTIKNLTVNTDKQGINAVACTGEETRSTLNVNNCTINATGTAKTDAGINFFAYWNVNVNGCTIVSANRGIYADGDGRNNTVIKNCNITANTSNGYGIYAQEGSTLEVSDTTIAVNGQSGIQSITASKELGTTVTLKNVTVNATDAYCIAVNPNNSYYIEDGSYISKNKDAAINAFGYGAYTKISGDAYVESNKNCAIRAYISGDANVYGQDGNAVLDIEGGTFVLTATNGGSALRAGTGDKGQSTINIKGGKFITYGTGPVINYVRADSTVNITGGTFENKGDAEIAVVANAADPNFVTVNFPAGVKLVEYRDGEFVDPNAQPPETTTEEITTAPIEPDDTDAPSSEDPDVTSAPSGEEPDEPLVGDSIGTVIAISIVATVALFSLVAILVIKKKKND